MASYPSLLLVFFFPLDFERIGTMSVLLISISLGSSLASSSSGYLILELTVNEMMCAFHRKKKSLGTLPLSKSTWPAMQRSPAPCL